MHTKNIFTLLLIGSSFFANAQQKAKSAQLPKEAATFLEMNFKGVEIQDVKKEKEGTTFKYEVKLTNGTEIQFNNRGRWREVESSSASLPVTMLQFSVGTYVQKNYPSATITEVKKGVRFNFVEINNETILQFDTEGNFYRIIQQ